MDPDWILFLAFLNGDKESYAALYLKYKGRVQSYVEGHLGHNFRDAEDVVHDVFESALRQSARKCEPYGKFEHWILKIASNKVIDRHRRSEFILASDADADVERSVREVPGRDWEPIRSIMCDERARCLTGAIARLPEREALAIKRRYLEGLPMVEVARRMECSVRTAHRVLAEALEALRRLLPQGIFHDFLEVHALRLGA
jgi:RNA polymerase sigma-70 factor, ECF subfamily